ncbi:MAG: hypothetical protein KDB58_08080 [Solirubrobacterales bacterium]|nr:hypothetical protein [Solirubrobacterales bacterium]MCB8969911.1 hypothetical protein [Thermoleophilales bacterium]MCO5327431.1 hypothetical protein [Solirubrobacterales bacterium]
MPGNQKPRRRKHRGTQTGSITRAQRSRPRNRQEAMAQARSRRSGGGGRKGQPVDRRDIPPTWRGAMFRGVIFAALLIPVSLLFGQAIGSAIVLSIVAAAFYVPLGFYTESFFYRRRQQKLAAERARAQAEKQKAKGR